MAPAPTATPQTAPRRRGRPRKHPLPPDSEPPLKKRRYNGIGGSARASLFGGSNGLGANGSLTVPRPRPIRRHSDIPGGAVNQTPITPFPRLQEESNHAHFGSAAATASAISQNEAYKPREERSWEDFHPDLDIDLALPIFSADEVDGPGTPHNGILNGSPIQGQTLQMLQGNGSPINPGSLVVTPPIKRRPGRPPKRPEAILQALGSPNHKITAAPLFNPKERLVLPKPNYRKIETFASYEKAPGIGINFVEKSFANVGYQESDIFQQPRVLIRGGKSSLEDDNDSSRLTEEAGESLAAHMRIRVEYDMDEQDERWLEVINSERTANGVDMIRPQYFEIAMTLIEKEWHALEKRIPKPNPKPPQTHRPRSSSAAAVNGEPAGAGEEQDSKCAVCDDGDCENTNAIVFCDGCDLAVHQECYGVPFIPEGQWLCRRCQLIGRNTSASFPHMCIFCPNVEGAFKQTTNMKWAHLLCAFWIPEVSIGNQTFMEPVQDVDKVPKSRWKLTCYICQQKMGACIQCSNKNCYLAFHVTCARKCRLQLKMKSAHGLADKNTLKGYCDKHVAAEWRQEHNCEAATEEAKEYYKRQYKGHHWADSQQTALAVEKAHEPMEQDAENVDDIFSIGSNKRKKALLKKIWRLPSGAPIVPQVVFNNVENILARWALRKRKEFVAEACKYWTLKREARRGASLLKRLQLQLETFTSMEMTRRDFAAMGAAGAPKLQQRIEFAENLERDLDLVRELVDKAKSREELKIKDVNLLRHLVDTVYFPIPPLLWPILERAKSIDSNYNYFKKGLAEVQSKLEQRFYVGVAMFANDIGQALHEVAFTPDSDIVEDLVPKPVSEPLNASDKNKPKATQKERLARAKRIMKAITPDLLDAAAKEAELGVKSPDEERHIITHILENAMRPPADSPHLIADVDTDDNAAGGLKDTENHEPTQVNGIIEDASSGQDKDVDMEDIDDTLSKPKTRRIPNGDISSHEEIEVDHIQPNDRETPGLNVPALSNSGSTNPSTSHEPLTPPHDHKELTSLAHGGVPWYHEKFHPNGTTVYDPEDQASPEDQLINGNRHVSEELSEMDDDAIDGLVSEVEKEKEKSVITKANKNDLLTVPTTSPRKKGKAKRRR